MTDDQMDEIKRHFNVVAENMLHEVSLVAEGHATLNDKIDRVGAESREQHAEAMAMSKTVHDSLDARIDSVRKELKEEIGSVRGELKKEIQLVGEKVDGHEARITTLEQKAA